MTLHYTIPGTPITKKNSQRIFRNSKTGKPFITRSAAYVDFEAAAAYFLKPLPPSPIDRPCRVTCLYYMPTRRVVDLTNLMEATHDVLVKCGVLKDDNSRIVASVDGSRVLYDKENPHTEIVIWEGDIR